MRTTLDVCGPDTLKVLQQIFDAVWLQIEKDGHVHQGNESNLREEVSRRVLGFAAGDVLDVDGIKNAVLQSFKQRAA